MEKISKTINNLTDLMEQDSRGVQITCYSIALFGLTVALRKVRPFSKFRKPSDIPNGFIEEKRELIGSVKRIDPNGALLIIEHKPLVQLPLQSSGDLPVKLSGVNVTSLGTNWLQSIVVGREVNFIPILKEKDFVQCKVVMTQIKKDNKREILNIAESLVKIGFATPLKIIEKPLPITDPTFLKYYSLLLHAEKIALRKKLGLKYYVIPTKKFLQHSVEKLILWINAKKTIVPKVVQKVPKIYHS